MKYFLYIILLLVSSISWANPGDTVTVYNVQAALIESQKGHKIYFTYYAQDFTQIPDSFKMIPAENIIGITIDDCPITDLPEYFSTYNHLQSIEIIWYYFAESPMKQIPNVIYSITSLKKLIFEGIPISGVSEHIKNLVNLEKLTLQYSHKITRFPVEVCALTQLKELDLACDSFTLVPSEIGNLVNLEALNFSGGACGGTPICSIPESIGNLKKLKLFSLSMGIKTWKLPEEFGELENLETIHFWYPKLSTLPQSFGKLKKLKSFTYAAGSELDSLPHSFFNLRSLNKLYFDVYQPKATLKIQAKRFLAMKPYIKEYEVSMRL